MEAPLKPIADLQAAARGLQADLQARFKALETAKKNTAFVGNAIRAMKTVNKLLNADAEQEEAEKPLA